MEGGGKPPIKKSQKRISAASEKDYIATGSTLHDRWVLKKRIGDGAFGQVFLASDLRDRVNVAIKTERLDVKRKCLCMEVAVLRCMSDCNNVPYIVACGRTDNHRYIVMELLGCSLTDFVRKMSFLRGRLPVDMVCKIGLQAISALHALHDVGFLHRDIKPPNFAFGNHPKVISHLFMFDFGLARIHLLANEKPRPKRLHVGFRGTVRYASLASHEGNDLGRVDDLIPVFYMLVELITGDLPWKSLERQEVENMKRNMPMEELCHNLPREFVKMGLALEKGTYKSQPKYDKLSSLLSSVLRRMCVDANQPITVTTGLCIPKSC